MGKSYECELLLILKRTIFNGARIISENTDVFVPRARCIS